MRKFLAKHAAATTGTLSCFDRLLFKGHLSLGYPHGMEDFLDHQGILFKQLRPFVLRQAERLRMHSHAYSADVDRPFRSKSIVESDHGDRVGAKRRWARGYLADFGSFFKDEVVLRTDSPESLIRWASWTSRSQIESAAVSSPITPCQRSGSS